MAEADGYPFSDSGFHPAVGISSSTGAIRHACAFRQGV
jgi:hypothetical protein